MSLRLIPIERPGPEKERHPKHFNPGSKIKKDQGQEKTNFSLKHLCLKLVHFINRGSRFTYEQIDDLIMTLQRGILGLQKRKQEILKKKVPNPKSPKFE